MFCHVFLRIVNAGTPLPLWSAGNGFAILIDRKVSAWQEGTRMDKKRIILLSSLLGLAIALLGVLLLVLGRGMGSQ